jgi:type IV secretion system protein VirB2
MDRFSLIARRYGPPLLVLGLAALPHGAFAQMVGGGTDPSTILQNIATYVTGPFGQALAILAVMACGFAFMLGRIGLFLLGGIVGGIVLVFGAAFLVQQFVGGAGG